MNGIEYSIRQTYVALRWGILTIVGLLFVAVLYVGVSTGEWQTSLSHYYYTAARPAFVAALCAIGASLIVYHAPNPENLLLDFAGFLAFIVAFVPTSLDYKKLPRGTINVPTAKNVEAIVQTNVLALLLAGFGAVSLGWWLWRREVAADSEGPPPAYTGRALAACVAALAFGLTIFLFASELVENEAHWIAAVGMFVLLFVVVVVNARRLVDDDLPTGFGTIVKWSLKIIFFGDDDREPPFYVYLRVARLMLVAAAGLGISGALGFAHWIFWAEAVLILLFGIFWQRQTAEFLEAITDTAVGGASDGPDQAES